MKKVLCCLFAAVLMFSLVACSGQKTYVYSVITDDEQVESEDGELAKDTKSKKTSSKKVSSKKSKNKDKGADEQVDDEKVNSKKSTVSRGDFYVASGDYATPDEDADKDFGTVDSYMLDYTFANPVFKDEYNLRDGMLNTIYKLLCGKDVTIAYIGGSITQENSWRVHTTKWFEDNYSGKVNEVDIGLAGTAADLAVCRIDSEVLVHNPDLVFIEYAVNGGRACDMEGMIRKIYNHDPNTDICFVYTSTVDNYDVYVRGKLPASPKLFEKIADFYGIPSVFFIKQAFDLYEQGKLTLSGSSPEGSKMLYSQDGTHLTSDGGLLAAGAIARSVKAAESKFDDSKYKITAHKIPNGYYETSKSWVNACATNDFSKMKFSGDWFDCKLGSTGEFSNYPYDGGYLFMFKRLFNTMKGTKTAGSSITIKFKGTDIGIFEAGGQYSGQLKVTVDGESKGKLVLYEKDYDSKLRHQYYFIGSLPNGEHTVTFTLDSEMPNKSALKSKNPGDTWYDRNELYIGKILLNGTLLDANK